MDSKKIFSIGYSGFGNDNVGGFIEMLQHFDINVLIDVRSNPYSHYYSEYNKENLEYKLKKEGIYYRNYAAEFGARQDDRSLYPSGYLDFELFSRTEAFNSGVSKVQNSVEKGYRLAFMCAEKEPVNCHRAILVTRTFSDSGYEINHILPNKTIKTQCDVECELLQLHPPSIFDDNSFDELTIAYRKQNEIIGVRLEDTK